MHMAEKLLCSQGGGHGWPTISESLDSRNERKNEIFWSKRYCLCLGKHDPLLKFKQTYDCVCRSTSWRRQIVLWKYMFTLREPVNWRVIFKVHVSHPPPVVLSCQCWLLLLLSLFFRACYSTCKRSCCHHFDGREIFWTKNCWEITTVDFEVANFISCVSEQHHPRCLNDDHNHVLQPNEPLHFFRQTHCGLIYVFQISQTKTDGASCVNVWSPFSIQGT